MASESLKPGVIIDKPTIIEGSTATTFVTSGWQAELDAASNLIMKRS
jgi:N-methylhydantoinase A/oxoprolinase/acetone carboxylase beta subunit